MLNNCVRILTKRAFQFELIKNTLCLIFCVRIKPNEMIQNMENTLYMIMNIAQNRRQGGNK